MVVVVLVVVVGDSAAARLATSASTSASTVSRSPTVAHAPRASMRAQVAENFSTTRATQAGSTGAPSFTARGT